MSSTDVPLQPVPVVDPQTSEGGAPAGLRSLQGIRWLLLVGGLVVAVSVIRLVAAEWQQLSASAQFLVLIAGALGVFAAGDLIRHRLHLPLAGSALHGLFVVLVPLLAWGAAYQGLVTSIWGVVVVGLGLLALLLACRRLLRRELAYDGLPYPVVLGSLLLSTAFLKPIGNALGWGEWYFLLSAALGGLAVRWASRHINRFLFHRDRREGIDQPIQLLPFGLLLTVYGAAMMSMPVPVGWMAVPLAFAAWALIDSGEEYYQALVTATGEAVTLWPPRSVLLLILGFASLAVSLGLAPGVGWARGWAVVSLIATARLLMWGLRYRSTVAYGSGLLAGLMAYHVVPALIPGLAKEIYRWMLEILGIAAGSAGVLSIGDIGLLALLIAAAIRWRVVLSRNMMRFHIALVAFHATVILVAGLGEPRALRWAALLALPLMIWATKALERVVLLPWVYAALACTALAWGWQPSNGGDLWSERGAFVLVLASVLFLGAGLIISRRWRHLSGLTSSPSERKVWQRLVALPVLCVLIPTGVGAFGFSAVSCSLLLLLLAPCFALMTVLLEMPQMGLLTALSVSGGILGLATSQLDEAWQVALTVQAVMLVAWGFERFLSRPTSGHDASEGLWGWTTGALVWIQAVIGMSLLVLAWIDPPMTLQALTLLLLGGYLFDQVGRQGKAKSVANAEVGIEIADDFYGQRFSSYRFRGQRAGLAVFLWLIYPVVQCMAFGMDGGLSLLLILSVTLSVLSGALHRQGGDVLAALYGCDVGSLRLDLERHLVKMRHVWRLIAAASCVIWTGPEALLLAALLAGEVLWRAHGRSQNPPPWGEKDPALLLTYLPALQLAASVVHWRAWEWGGWGQPFLSSTLLDFAGYGPVALVAATWIWCQLMERLAVRGVVRPTMVLQFAELVAAACVLWGLNDTPWMHSSMADWRPVGFISATVLFTLWNLRRGWTGGQPVASWNAQGWLTLGVFHTVACGWLQLDQPTSALLLVAIAVALEGWTGWLRRASLDVERKGPLVQSAFVAASLWALVGSGISLAGALDGGSSWWPIAPAVMVSIFFALRARRGEGLVASATLASSIFAIAFSLMVHRLPFLGPEVYFLGPGLALMALSWLLAPRISREARSRLFTCGVVAVYGTPMMGLLGQFGWVWQIALLLTAIAFGALSFRLRSRSLLTVSTAALIVDLVFFVIKLRRTEPTLLWVVGIVFGLALMGGAAFLEHRREEVEQRIRIWGQELKSWS